MRDTTNRILEAAEAGELTWEQIARVALDYMSEASVADLAHKEEFFIGQDYAEEDTDFQE